MSTILSVALLEKIGAQLKKQGNPKIYWDPNDEVPLSAILKALKDNPEYPLAEIDEHFTNLDVIYHEEIENIKNALSMFEDDLREELEIDEDVDVDYQTIADDLKDNLSEHFYVDLNYESLLSRTQINIRVTMHSNYDCINSHWFESQNSYEMDSYFGDMVRMLHFNPASVKKFLLKKGLKVNGYWPNKPNKRPVVTLDDFWTELVNSTCGANNLVFIGHIDAYEFLTKYQKEMVITIPKGNTCGLFSHTYGGGSLLEMKLLYDYKITQGKAYDDSGYLNFDLVIDDKSSYSIKDVYGVGDSFFGDCIKIDNLKQKSHVQRVNPDSGESGH